MRGDEDVSVATVHKDSNAPTESKNKRQTGYWDVSGIYCSHAKVASSHEAVEDGEVWSQGRFASKASERIDDAGGRRHPTGQCRFVVRDRESTVKWKKGFGASSLSIFSTHMMYECTDGISTSSEYLNIVELLDRTSMFLSDGASAKLNQNIEFRLRAKISQCSALRVVDQATKGLARRRCFKYNRLQCIASNEKG